MSNTVPKNYLSLIIGLLLEILLVDRYQFSKDEKLFTKKYPKVLYIYSKLFLLKTYPFILLFSLTFSSTKVIGFVDGISSFIESNKPSADG